MKWVKGHLEWLWAPKTPLEKFCMALIWASLLFSILCNFAVGVARAEPGPVVYEVEGFEKACPEVDSATEQYVEVVAIAGMCEAWVERLDHLGLLIDDQHVGRELRGIREGIPITNETLPVVEQEPVSLAMTEEAVTAAGAAQKEAIWAFAGVAIGLFFGYGIYRQVLARG